MQASLLRKKAVNQFLRAQNMQTPIYEYCLGAIKNGVLVGLAIFKKDAVDESQLKVTFLAKNECPHTKHFLLGECPAIFLKHKASLNRKVALA
jgi:hypothetical protein